MPHFIKASQMALKEPYRLRLSTVRAFPKVMASVISCVVVIYVSKAANKERGFILALGLEGRK